MTPRAHYPCFPLSDLSSFRPTTEGESARIFTLRRVADLATDPTIKISTVGYLASVYRSFKMTHSTSSTPVNSSETLKALARNMTQLREPEWMALGVSQDFHQRILTSFFSRVEEQALVPQESDQEGDQETALEMTQETLSAHQVPMESILSSVESTLNGTVKNLFKLTGSSHVEQLVVSQWFTHEERYLVLHPQRLKELSRCIHQDDAGQISVYLVPPEPAFDTDNSLDPTSADQLAGARIKSESPGLNYVDPLDHISSDIESPFTIRRLDQIITYLDGVVLRREQVGEQLKIPLSKRDLIFDATNRLGLTHQEDDYLKLDFLGLRIARMPRDERLKTLAMMASRLRSEAKLLKSREASTSS